MTHLLRVLAILALWAVPAVADDSRGPRSTMNFEISSHRALERVRASEDGALAPFTTDGCSGGLSSVWTVVVDRFPGFASVHGNIPPWEACCIDHDRVYHSAGMTPDAQASFEARLLADEALKLCVVETGERRLAEIAGVYNVEETSVREAYRAISNALFIAVRFGGAPCSGLPWRWGYGFPDCYVTPKDLLGKP